jgi:hypothetical protein
MDELRKRGWKIELRPDDPSNWISVEPPDDATEEEIEAVGAFLVEVVKKAIDDAGATGKVDVKRC